MEQRADQSGRSRVSREQLNGFSPPQPRRKLTKREFAFAEEGLNEMHHLIEECTRMSERRDELESRFKQACMQKAWIIVMSFLLGLLLLLFSFVWSGVGVNLFRLGLVSTLAGLYFAPVHWFNRGQLREDARLVRQLDKKGLANAKQAARIGESMNRKFRKLSGVKHKPPP